MTAATLEPTDPDDSGQVLPAKTFLDVAPPYRARLLATSLVVALGFIGVSVVGLIREGSSPGGWLQLGVGILFGLAAAALFVDKNLIFPDRLEHVTLFGRRRLRYDEVALIRLLAPGRFGGSDWIPVQNYPIKLYGPGAKTSLDCRDYADYYDAFAPLTVKLYGPGAKISLDYGIYDAIAPLVVPRLAEEFDRQIEEIGSVRFGKLTATSDGLRTPKGKIPWHFLSDVSVEPGRATLIAEVRCNFTVRVPSSTDNLPVLIYLIGKKQRPKPFSENRSDPFGHLQSQWAHHSAARRRQGKLGLIIGVLRTAEKRPRKGAEKSREKGISPIIDRDGGSG